MLDVNAFYRQLGATGTLNSDEQLLLEGKVRVLCAQDSVTAVFESLSTGEDKLDAMLNLPIATWRVAVYHPLRPSGHTAIQRDCCRRNGQRIKPVARGNGLPARLRVWQCSHADIIHLGVGCTDVPQSGFIGGHISRAQRFAV